MRKGIDSILQEVNSYYSSKVKDFGATPKGVDWNGSDSQRVRFEQLLKVIPSNAQVPVSLNDFGCGYGALLAFIEEQGREVDYHGFDLSPAMIDAARQAHPSSPAAQFEVASACSRIADYSVASGLFNVRQSTTPEEWQQYIAGVLGALDASSRQGFAFNCLTSYSDAEYKRDYLYYGDPCFYFDYCKRTFSNQVALLHDYGLFEFTVIVRKTA